MEELSRQFTQLFGATPRLYARAPGRVNLLGEHVDYNEGPVLPAAIDRSLSLCASPTPDGVGTIFAADLDESISFNVDALEDKRDVAGHPLPRWALYSAGVAWALQSAGLEVSGLQAVFTSDVPIGAGLSSSAALEVAFAITWQTLSGWELERMQLAQLCQKAENQYVGVSSGLMDQFASVHGVSGHALYFDTRDLSWEPVPLPPDTTLIIADSGVRRSLSDSAYNERRKSCEQAVRILRQYLPAIQSLRDVSSVEFAAYSTFLPPVVRKRAEHVVKEIARVQSALTALKREDTNAFGALMFSGHASLRDLYEVSRPELDALVELARDLPGCYGARLTGAGFGGCTVNLVEESQAPEFIRSLEESYQRQTGLKAQVYLCNADNGADARWLW